MDDLKDQKLETNNKSQNEFKPSQLLPIVILSGLIILALVEMAWLSIARYLAYNASTFDLGVMSQAIWSVADGQPLVFTAQGIAISRLARHVELFYFLLAPLYKLFPSPTVLLLVQAALYAAGAIPVYRLACRRLTHAGVSLVLVTVYLLYPALQAAVLFDFHGDTLAVAFLMFAIEAADRQSWRSYAIWIALALSCKMTVAAPVAALGFVLWLTGQRRAGILTMLAAVGWGLTAFFLVRQIFAPAEAALAKATADSYMTFYFGQLDTIAETWLARLLTVLVVSLPAIWLAWRAPLWLIPAAIVIIPVAISTGPGPSYDYRFHHYALAAPFLISAIVYGAVALQEKANNQSAEKRRWPWHLPVAITLLITIIWNSFFVNTPLNPAFFQPPAGADLGMNNISYGITQRDQLKVEWI
jgi:uncharacterized membrane protein